jgi:hypothetical protein
VIDGQVVRPLELVSAELKASVQLAAKGVEGDAVFPKSILNHTYGDSVITNIKLSHELWASGVPLLGGDPQPLMKLAGIDGHAIVIQNPETKMYLFMLPVEVAPSDIPPRYRDSQESLSAYLSEIENTLENNLGVARL